MGNDHQTILAGVSERLKIEARATLWNELLLVEGITHSKVVYYILWEQCDNSQRLSRFTRSGLRISFGLVHLRSARVYMPFCSYLLLSLAHVATKDIECFALSRACVYNNVDVMNIAVH
jgi:hypothetical protein